MSAEIEFSPVVKEKMEKFHGKCFAGADGEPLTIEDISVSLDKDDNVMIHLQATLLSVLKDRNNPGAGVAEQIEPRIATVLIKVKADNKITFSMINKAFNLNGEDVLVDDGESWERFAEDHPKSIYNKIVNQKSNLYFTGSVKPNTKGDDATVYYNIFSPAVKKKMTLKNLKAMKAAVGQEES